MTRALVLLALAPLLTAQKQGFSAEDDKRIEADIRARLAKSAIGKEGFTIRVQGGVARWEGTTTVPQRKGAATRMARAAGAAKVVNNIRVTGGKQPPPAKPKTEGPPPPPRRVKVQWRYRK
jgi:hypothetical protein